MKIKGKSPKKAISRESGRVTISMHDLQAELPGDVKTLLALWRECKDKVDMVELEVKPFKQRMKEIQDKIAEHLSIEDGEEKSETISVPNTAWVYKTKSVGVKVNDYDSFQRFCIRNGLEFALRKQVNLTGVREMYRMIMEGDLPEPKSADFYTFDKVTIRKR
tara:strand:- start:1094 stop:1582 length:489 start_codon:yes stop_codon:yes gene_type:complete